MSSTRNDLPSIPENLAALVDLASSLVEGTPENSVRFTPTVNDSTVDEDSMPEDDLHDILNRVMNDEEGFGEDYLHSTASTLIDHSKDTYVLPQKLLDHFELQEDDSKKVTFGVNVAKDMVEISLKNEITMILNGCQHMFKKVKPSIYDLFDYFFGETSLIVKHLQKHLSVDYEMFLKFLRTVYVMQAYRLSSAQLFDKNSLIDKEVMKVSPCI